MLNNFLNIKIAIIACLCIVMLPSCDDDSETVTTTTTSLGTKSVSTDFIMYIHNQDLSPVQGAHFSLAGFTYCTNEDGIVVLRNLTIPPAGEVFEISSPDHVNAVGHLHSVDDGENYVAVPLVKTADVQSPVINKVSTAANIQITYPDSLLNSKNEKIANATSSMIAVKSNVDINYLPSKIRIDNARSISFIESEVEIIFNTMDNEGQFLTLPNDSFITITVSDLTATSDSIHYYSYESSSSTWEQSGYIHRDGSEYIGKLNTANNHIVIGSPKTPAILVFKASDQDGFSLNNLPYAIKDQATEKYLTSGITDQNGYGKIIVPANSSLEVVPIIDGSSLVAEEINSITDTVEIMFSINGTPLTGSVQKCSSTPDSSAVISYHQGADLLFSFANESTFSVTLLQDIDASFQAYNPSLLSKSEELLVSSPSDGDDIGTLALCETLETNAIVTINSNITTNTLWRNCDTYILDGLIYIETGAVLTIEAGTLIKAEAGLGALASGLVVTAGAEIIAKGTVDSPIIFTSVLDEIRENSIISPNLTEADKALWAGLILLGDAPVSSINEPATLSGMDSSNPHNIYGGSNAAHSAGELRYISIRHAGSDVSADRLAGLTLAGTGSDTKIDHIEVVSPGANGLSLYGGTTNLNDVLVTSPTTNGVAIDQSYAGQLSNFVVILDEGSRNGFTMEGGKNTLKSSATLSRGSVRGHKESTANPSNYFTLTNAAKGSISNSYFFNFSEQSQMVINDLESAENYLMDSLLITNLAIDTTALTGGNNTVELILSDKSGMDIFETKPTDTQLVDQPTFGASKNVFSRWTYTDALDKLEDF